MQNYKEYFKGKKITVMGLGLLGGALNDAIFLAKCGAKLTITDLKSAEELAISLKKLSKYSGIKYVLGRHELEDFRNADLILQPGNVPPNSPYLLEAQKNNIPIHESESLFFSCLPEGVKTIGVTGTRGKTTTTRLIYEILKEVLGRRVYLAGNIQGKSTLALLNIIKPGDTIVLELDSWCLHGMGEVKKSPNVAVFTNLMPDHLNFYLKGSRDQVEAMEKYFTDKAQIYLHQAKKDFLICGTEISRKIGKIKSRKIIADKKDLPESWKIKLPGEHNCQNIICAVKAVEAFFKLTSSTSEPWSTCKKVVENFNGVEGRLQFLKKYKGIEIYNDTTATTPDATIAALKSLQGGTLKKRKIVLICGGADKGLDMSGLVKEIPKYCKAVVFLAGSGTEKLTANSLQLKAFDYVEVNNLRLAIDTAINLCRREDILLFSPAFASFGMFKNEYDRGDKFNNIINGLSR